MQYQWSTLPDSLIINTNDVHVIGISLKNKVPDNEDWLVLSDHEKKQAEKFKFSQDQINYILTHSYLRKVIALFTHREANSIIFKYNSYGKPYLSETPEIGFNLSHSDDQVLIAIARNSEVGVDIEKIKDIDIEPIINRILSPLELEEISNLTGEKRTHAFYNVWTQKEAAVKALGIGLSTLTSNFNVTIHHADHPYTIKIGEQSLSVKHINWNPEYSSAIALSSPKENFHYWRFT